MKTIMLAGGGTGGHIMPLIAIAKSIKNSSPDTRIIAITEKGSRYIDQLNQTNMFDDVREVRAGKYRRYSNLTFLQRIIKVKTFLLNMRDMGFFVLGYMQSRRLLRQYKPDFICFSGGYVALPVGYAAQHMDVMYATNDLDAVPGLTNRLLAHNAKYNFVAMDPKFYKYNSSKMIHAGVPIDTQKVHASLHAVAVRRNDLSARGIGRVLLVTGGSSGATALDTMVASAAKNLLLHYPDMLLVHQVGKGGDDLYASPEFAVVNKQIISQRYFDNLLEWSAVADIVVSRAGASAMTEFGLQSKAVVVVPSPYLAGQHQVKNAKILDDAGAAVLVEEGHPSMLELAIKNLFDNPKQRQKIAAALYAITKPEASDVIARTILLEL